MKQRYFLFQLKTFLNNPKNIGLFILTILVSLYFGLISVPNHQVIERVEQRTIRKEYVDDSVFLKGAQIEVAYAKKPGYNYIPSKGAIDAVNTYPQILRYDKKMLKALKDKNWQTYTKNSSKHYKYIDHLIFNNGNKNFLYPIEYNHNNNYLQDGHYGYQRTYHLYNALLLSNKRDHIVLNKNILEERTALQSIQTSLCGWTVLIILLIICFFSSDVITNDKKYLTVFETIPLSKRTILWLKTGVIEVGVLLDLLTAAVIILACIVPRYGFGSFQMNTVAYMGQINYKSIFLVESLGTYYLQFLVFAALIVFILIRMNILITLVIRNEYLSGIFVSLFAISGKVLYFSSGMGFVYPVLKKLPMTYFTIGDSLNGSLAYMMDTPGWGFNTGIIPLVTLVIIIELLLFLVTKCKRLQLVE